MKITVIIPTCGRASLKRTLESIQAQKDGPNEVLVISDGHHPDASDVYASTGLHGQFIEVAGPHDDCGGYARNVGLYLAKGHYIHCIDDDDTYRPGAFTTIRQYIGEAHGPHLFKIFHNSRGKMIWDTPVMEHGNVSTQMLVFPNIPSMPMWGYWRSSDYGFIKYLCDMWPETFWHEDVIANRNF
jgi:glycosyltransferase involved in cell wall biosynthesis